MQPIDIEQIMSEIRAEIKEKGYTESTLKFQDIEVPKLSGGDCGQFEYAELCYECNKCNENWNNPMFFPFPSNNPIKVFIQKLLRKISKCVFWPIVNYQNSFNADVVRFQNQVKYYIGDAEKRKKELETEISELHEVIQQLKVDNQQMQAEITNMQNMEQQLNEKLCAECEEKTGQIGMVSRQLMGVKWKQIDDLCGRKEKGNDLLTCKICGHEAKRKTFEIKMSECIFNGGMLERYVCPECGVIFGPTKFSDMDQKEIDADYQVHYYGFREGDSFEKEIEAFYMLKPNKDGIYLNYGCGCWSKSIQKLRSEGYNVYGYEPYAPETDNPYMITNKDEIAKMRFDGIYSNDLLEHLINPIEDLLFMKSLLMNPDAKMSHSTACYAYVHEYTRFHTHFFTGKSLDVLCERAGLKILDSRDELENNDFICYVFGIKENYVSYGNSMWLSAVKEEAERKNGLILLHKKGIMCGPYIVQGKGIYKVGVDMELPKAIQSVTLSITADKGKKRLGEFELVNGSNTFSYTLDQLEKDIEFTVINSQDEDIIIRAVRMYGR